MTTKLLSFSEDQLLALYLTHRGKASELPGGTLVRADGIISDNYYRLRLRKAYARLLASGNPDLLPVTEIAESLNSSLTIDPGTLVATVELPESVLMPIEISLASWDTPISVFYSPEHPIAQLQKNPFSRMKRNISVGVLHRRELKLYSAKSVTDSIKSAYMVVRPPENFYTFAEAALPLMLEA